MDDRKLLPRLGLPYRADPNVEQLYSSLLTRRYSDTCVSCWDSKKKLIPCNQTAITGPTDQPTIDLGSVAVVHVEALYSIDPRNLPSSAVVGEWMNESSGKWGRLQPADQTWSADVPVQAGVNEIRVALFDPYGNESFDRITVTVLGP